MNEQIKNLAIKSGLLFQRENLSYEEKKFAELIIQECAEQIKTQGISASSEDYGDYEIGFNAGLFHALRTTKEHFGVEE
jgi:hypothetical protein